MSTPQTKERIAALQAGNRRTLADHQATHFGWQVSDGILQELGLETIQLEREFNRRAGFTAADDRLPEWMTEEALTPTGAVFDVPAADLDGVFD